LEAGDAVVDGMQRTKTEGKPFWPTFRIWMAKQAAQKMRVDAATGGKGQVNGKHSGLFN
jgi:hypothetical protein